MFTHRIEAKTLILLTFSVAVAACNGSGYDSPTTPWPAAFAANLSGTWTGTVTVEGDDFENETCREPVTANLTQDGSRVAGPSNDAPSPKRCLQEAFSFHGSLEGRNLLGTIVEANYPAYGVVEGERGDRLNIRAMNVIFELRR
jgi:hypothetical protein